MKNDQTKIDHPSFGFIRASRVSGHKALFDSSVRHQHYVDIVIGEATQFRQYQTNYVHADKELIRVSLSESQFAQFITSMNSGSGSPCTLARVNGKSVEEPPADINTRDTFEREVKEAAEGMTARLDELSKKVEALIGRQSAPTKRELRDIKHSAAMAKQDLLSKMPFMMKQFAEGVEKLTDRAKMDLNAHATMLGQRLVALPGGVDTVAVEGEGDE